MTAGAKTIPTEGREVVLHLVDRAYHSVPTVPGVALPLRMQPCPIWLGQALLPMHSSTIPTSFSLAHVAGPAVVVQKAFGRHCGLGGAFFLVNPITESRLM